MNRKPKKILLYPLLLICMVGLLPLSCLLPNTMSYGKPPKPPLIKGIYTADPSAHVFDGKLYIYPSHDKDDAGTSHGDGNSYDMVDYHVFSMESIGGPVTDHGQVLHVKDVPWATRQMWAPDAACRNDKCYLYFPAKDRTGRFRIGVAVGDGPTGPFKAEPTPIEGSYSIDPAVFIDDDGQAYMYFGGIWGGELEKWSNGKFDPTANEPAGNEPAIKPRVAKLSDDMLSFASAPQEIDIVNDTGKPVYAQSSRRFFEGAWMHKYKGYYYLSYSTGNFHKIVYAIGKSPTGPFRYMGVVLNPVLGWTTHHSIVAFKGKWYLFYHDASCSGGIDHQRCVKMAPLEYRSDGTIREIDPE